jgi:hypothetical protein
MRFELQSRLPGPWPHFNVDGVWVNEATSDY